MSGFTTKNYKEKRYTLRGAQNVNNFVKRMKYETPVTNEECFTIKEYSIDSTGRSKSASMGIGGEPVGEVGEEGQGILLPFYPVTARSYGEPDYDSFGSCLRFWEKIVSINIDDLASQKNVVYNLTAVHKYLCEIEFGGVYRGVIILPELYWVLPIIFNGAPQLRIKSPEKFFEFFVNTWVDIYNTNYNHSDAMVKAANIVMDILKNEQDDEEKDDEGI